MNLDVCYANNNTMYYLIGLTKKTNLLSETCSLLHLQLQQTPALSKQLHDCHYDCTALRREENGQGKYPLSGQHMFPAVLNNQFL